jgi:uncharacterized protein YcbK (DUF882 family)
VITPHFSEKEFACHDGISYPHEWVENRLKPLCEVLEVIRSACGDKGITILSGYRSPQHNLDVGGASASQHMVGRAADITVAGMNAHDVHEIVLQLYRDGKIQIGGLGSYAGWVHVDIRHNADGRLRRWAL